MDIHVNGSLMNLISRMLRLPNMKMVNSEYLVEIAKEFKAIPHNRTRAISTKRRSFHCAALPKTREPTKEELIAALMLLHVIQNPPETLSDADMQFLTNIVTQRLVRSA